MLPSFPKIRKTVAGIGYHRGRLSWLSLYGTPGNWEMRGQREVVVSHNADEQLLPEVSSLERLLQGVTRDVPTRVALPDPWFDYILMELDEKPRSKKLLRKILQRNADELGSGNHTKRFGIQWLGQTQGHKQRLYAVAIDESFARDLESLFFKKRQNLVLADASINYHLCALSEGTRCSAALVVFNSDYWTVALWDEFCHLRFVKSQWRSGGADDLELIERSVRQLIISVTETEQFPIERLYFIAENEADEERLSNILESGENSSEAWKPARWKEESIRRIVLSKNGDQLALFAAIRE